MSAQGLWRRALGRGAEWRYLALFVAGVLVPTTLAYVPVASFFHSLFDYSTRETELVSWLDSRALSEVLRQITEPDGAGISPGLTGAALVSAVVAPMLAGAALALARKSGPLGFRALLGGAGELYPRMLRMAIASTLPLGVAAGGAGLAFHLAGTARESAVLESAASRARLIATLASVLLFWLANVTVEAGRAYLGAEPDRRSALAAWWSGARLLVRRPSQVLGLSLVTTASAVGAALLLTAFRLRITQSGAASIAEAFVVAQLAVAALAWGRASRLAGLIELIRAEESA